MTASFEHLGHVEVADAQAVVDGIDEARWWEHDFRQRRSPAVHGATQSIPLRFHWRGVSVVDDGLLDAFGPLLGRVRSVLDGRLPGRRLAGGNALVVRLPAGASVGEHVDRGRYLRAVRRVHVPLVVNDSCTFTVAGVEHRPRPGRVYLLRNTLPHAAANRGSGPRIHLICDWLVDGDRVTAGAAGTADDRS